MTYCVAACVDAGVVFCSDSRTNAGVDHVSTYGKMHRFGADGERQVVVLTAGNLATTQSVVTQLKRDANNPNVAHQLRVVVDQNLVVSGTAQWPANPALGLPARQFSLSGRVQANGKIEFVDNTPELIAGFRRGVYVGNLNPASGRMSGQYYEVNESTNELFYFGDWSATR